MSLLHGWKKGGKNKSKTLSLFSVERKKKLKKMKK